MSTINILLFGESGAGKSTTINALANYLRFSSFDRAIESDFVNVIPSRITLIHPTTYENLVAQDEQNDPGEQHIDAGRSVTQEPKNYEFNYEGRKLCFIDTPGMGDTGGLDVDKKNFEKIIKHLRGIESLHAVCFLIKTTTTRKTASFNYALNQLLINLPRNSVRNLVFCFTFCRSSQYGVGDGFETLRSQLSVNELGCENVQLVLGGNCFFIDNEAYGFLLARKHGYPFVQDYTAQYRESWDKSVGQIRLLINRIIGLSPFAVDNMITLIENRKILPQLVDELIAKLGAKITALEEISCKRSSIVTKRPHSINESLIQEYQKEVDAIQMYAKIIIRHLICTTNTNVENFIRPYLWLLPSSEQLQRTGSKRPRLMDKPLVKIQSISIEAQREIIARIKAGSNRVTIEDLNLEQAKCRSILKHSSEEFCQIVGIAQNSAESKKHQNSLYPKLDPNLSQFPNSAPSTSSNHREPSEQNLSRNDELINWMRKLPEYQDIDLCNPRVTYCRSETNFNMSIQVEFDHQKSPVKFDIGVHFGQSNQIPGPSGETYSDNVHRNDQIKTEKKKSSKSKSKSKSKEETTESRKDKKSKNKCVIM